MIGISTSKETYELIQESKREISNKNFMLHIRKRRKNFQRSNVALVHPTAAELRGITINIKRCALITIDENIAVEAAKIHTENKIKTPDFGLANAFILAAARKRD